MTRHSLQSKSIFALFMLIAIVASSPLLAVDKIRVMALFHDKAMVQIDGKQRLLKAGEKSPEGVLLVSANANEAILEINGERGSYGLGSQVGGHFAVREMVE
ncbi:MAG: hypothetical protein OQK92_10650, partial [Sedimenticola sp.]|nr:hypothetical protein [Sedimenticola sp.]